MMTLDDVYRFEDFGLQAKIEYNHPGTPEITNKTVKVPGVAGLYDFGVELGVKQFIINLDIIENNQVELFKKGKKFIDFLFDQHGQPQAIKVTFDFDPDKYYMVKLNQILTLAMLLSVSQLTLNFVANDPYAYNALNTYNETFEYGNFSYDDGLIYPNTQSFNWIYRQHMTGLYNHSHYETPLALTITGDVINPRITNYQTGKFMQFELSLAGRTLTIEKDTIKVDAENGYPYLTDGDFFTLQSGNNGLTFEGASPDCEVLMNWKHKFM